MVWLIVVGFIAALVALFFIALHMMKIPEDILGGNRNADP